MIVPPLAVMEVGAEVACCGDVLRSGTQSALESTPASDAAHRFMRLLAAAADGDADGADGDDGDDDGVASLTCPPSTEIR